MEANVSIYCSTPRCKEVMSRCDDVYCSKCMDSKTDEIAELEHTLGEREDEISELKLEILNLKNIIAGCDRCTAVYTTDKL